MRPPARDQPRSSATSFRFSSASGRARSKLSSTMTSVPPWIGTASGRSAFRRRASSSDRGVRTSMSGKCIVALVDELTRRLAVARGDEPADLVVRGGRVFSVFTREWLETDGAGGGGVGARAGGLERGGEAGGG